MAESTTPPVFSFTHHPSSSPFLVPSAKYKASNPSRKDNFFATGALVFDDSNSSTPRVLLIQRSAGDSMPGLWEIPGGGVDEEDESILHAVARELWEEAALTAASIGPLVGGPHFFGSRSGKGICKFNFLVETNTSEGPMHVKLDPKEHQKFVWATEEEVNGRKVGDLELEFTSPNLETTVLEGFQTRKEAKKMPRSN